MKLAITQPTFLPWHGYFSLLNYVDEVVMLDNVQFDKRSWQQRNRINFNGKNFFLTVPVLSKNNFHQKIKDVKIHQNTNYIKKHIKTIEASYSKSKYFKDYFVEIKNIYEKNFKNILDLNMEFIKYFLSKINSKTSITYLSDLKIEGSKEKLILNICNYKKCTNYISTQGSKNYLEKINKSEIKFKIKFFDTHGNHYSQSGKEFLHNCSFIDLLFNLGPESNEFLKNNFKIEENK